MVLLAYMAGGCPGGVRVETANLTYPTSEHKRVHLYQWTLPGSKGRADQLNHSACFL